MNLNVRLIPDDYTFRPDEFRYHVGSLLQLQYQEQEQIMHMRYPLLVGLALAIWAGVVVELHQAFVPGRAASLMDLGYDSLGAAFFLLGLKAWLFPHSRLSGVLG